MLEKISYLEMCSLARLTNILNTDASASIIIAGV